MKKCVCIKDWREYKVGEEATYLIGQKTWFLGGFTISSFEFKEHFRPL